MWFGTPAGRLVSFRSLIRWLFQTTSLNLFNSRCMIGINRNESNILKKVNDMFVSCLGNQTLKATKY